MTTAPSPPGWRAYGQAWPWLVGAALALAVVGPALRSGNLFLLDATFVHDFPVPSGIWGLGPELPRRVPLGLALAWFSAVLGGAASAAMVMGAAVMVAFAGAARLAAGAPGVARLGAGLVYGVSPFLLTRLGAGQLNVLAATAVLPWALPSLLAPGKRPATTFLWAAAMAATGSVGGSFVAVAVLVGLVAERSAAAVAGTALAAVAQLPWLVPGLVVASAGGLRLAGSTAFPTHAHGVGGALRLLAGQGFWRVASQVGGDAGPGAAVLGTVLGVLAVLGASALPRAWRWRALALAGLGVVIALAGVLPGLRTIDRAFSATVVGASFREGQRAMAFTLVWVAPAAAFGAVRLGAARGRLAPTLVRCAPAAAAGVLAFPGLWGVGERLRPAGTPAGWSRARAEIHRRPGPVLALPFDRHLPLAVAGGQEVLNPLPDALGGDVISSPALGAPADVELADPRLAALGPVLRRARGAEPVAGDLARVGVRWVVLLHSADWRAYRGLRADPGLAEVVNDTSLQLFEVGPWAGPLVGADGHRAVLATVVAPLRRLPPSGPLVW
ncbi:MAG: hypothetical protein M3063_10820, partial [Actinomycetota bacterium]|nr:hypothetical protein [Actinomycetota bacterium]